VSTNSTAAGRKSASDAQQRILTALRELGKASALQISEHAELAYSTTTAKLRSLEAAGQARRERHPDGATIWQPADLAAGTAAENPPPEVTTTTAGTPNAGKSKPSSRRTRTSGARPKDQPVSGERTAPSGAGSGLARSDAGANDAGDGQRARRAKGALRAEVLAVLQDHPDATFKVSQVCKRLPGASAGAIANALDKLVAEGTARQVADRPATYQAE
jgi:hypothetical protein